MANNMQGIAWFQANETNFPSSQRMIIQKRCSEMPEDRLMMLQQLKWKNPTLILIMSLMFGSLGIDRFMLGNVGVGLLKLFTFGLFGILTIIDWFTVMGKAREINMKTIQAYL